MRKDTTAFRPCEYHFVFLGVKTKKEVLDKMELIQRLFKGKSKEGSTPPVSHHEVVQRFFIVGENGEVIDENNYYEVRRLKVGGQLAREHIYLVTKEGHPDAKPGEEYATKVDRYPAESKNVETPEERKLWVASLTHTFPERLASEDELTG